jgi:hypothetical protein
LKTDICLNTVKQKRDETRRNSVYRRSSNVAHADLWEQVERKQAARTATLLGRSDEAHLRWLVKFAATDDFAGMSALKFERIRRQVLAFAVRGGSSLVSARDPISPSTVRRLANRVRDGLRAYANGASWDLPVMKVARSAIPNSGRAAYSAPWNHVFLLAAADLLDAAGSSLRVCAARDCDAVFVRQRRMIYCSPSCSGRERMRRFQADRDRYRRKRRQYYIHSLRRVESRNR